jgi:hypothetical protein
MADTEKETRQTSPFPKSRVIARSLTRARLHAHPLLSQGERAIFMNTYAGSFVMTPTAILHSSTLTPGAKTLYGILKSHSRQKRECFPSYSRLCLLMGRCENTVRTHMRELIAGGLVEQQRRGRGRSNIYTLRAFTLAVAGEVPTQEHQCLMPNKTVLKPRKEKFDSCPHCPQTVDNLDSMPSMYITDSPLPEPEKIVCPAPIARLVSDVGAEMRDVAPSSTRTRIAKIHQRSGLSDNAFITEAIAARHITRQRFGKIHKRNRGGQVMPMAYFLAVIAQRVGATPPRPPPPRPPVTLPPHTPHPEPPRPLVPPIPRPPTPDTVRFWQTVNEATGISNQREFVTLVGRVAPMGDVAWAVRLVHEARK